MSVSTGVTASQRKRRQKEVAEFSSKDLQYIKGILLKFLRENKPLDERVSVVQVEHLHRSSPVDVATEASAQHNAFALATFRRDNLEKNLARASALVQLIDEGWDGYCTKCEEEVVPEGRIVLYYSSLCRDCASKKEKEEKEAQKK